MNSKTSTPRPAVTCGDHGGRNQQGEACGVAMNLSATTGLCLHHDPARVDEARALYKTGSAAAGRATHLRRIELLTTEPVNLPRAEPDTLGRLARWHRWVVRAVATGEIDARTAHEITCSLKELRPVLLNLNLERRVKELEMALKKARKELERRG